MLRGMRTLTDIESEFTMSLANRTLEPNIETVFLMASEKYSHISSSLIKQIALLGRNGTAEQLSDFLPEEMIRGADGAMTGFAFPEMLVGVVNLCNAGRTAEASDLFDAYLPIIRLEQQPGAGLAIRKEILKRRGALSSAATRRPGPKLTAEDIADLDRLLARLDMHLKDMAHGS